MTSRRAFLQKNSVVASDEVLDMDLAVGGDNAVVDSQYSAIASGGEAATLVSGAVAWGTSVASITLCNKFLFISCSWVISVIS